MFFFKFLSNITFFSFYFINNFFTNFGSPIRVKLAMASKELILFESLSGFRVLSEFLNVLGNKHREVMFVIDRNRSVVVNEAHSALGWIIFHQDVPLR